MRIPNLRILFDKFVKKASPKLVALAVLTQNYLIRYPVHFQIARPYQHMWERGRQRGIGASDNIRLAWQLVICNGLHSTSAALTIDFKAPVEMLIN